MPYKNKSLIRFFFHLYNKKDQYSVECVHRQREVRHERTKINIYVFPAHVIGRSLACCELKKNNILPQFSCHK